MNILKNISNNNERIPADYRKNHSLEEIRNDILELENISNQHVLNLKSLLFLNDKKTIKSIEANGKLHVMDLEIDNEEHSYIANGIPVHNTINLPSDYKYEDFKNIYLNAYNTGTIKGVTTYRAGTMTSVLKSIDEKPIVDKIDHIYRNSAPKRPSEVYCDVHNITAKGIRWTVFIGLIENESKTMSPYEVFAFKKKNLSLPIKITKGKLIKKKSGIYNFLTDDGLELENIAEFFDRDEQEALTRQISLSLRHGAHVKFVVDQLNKSDGTIVSFSKAIARTLKKYIKDSEYDGDICPECGGTIIMQEGCLICRDCGYSKC